MDLMVALTPRRKLLPVSQIVQYNTLRKHSSNTSAHYKDQKRETPVVVYNTLKIYSTVRSRTLIDHLFSIGLCMPYKRLLDVTKQLYDEMMKSFENNKMFIPNHLRKGLFIVLVKDNLDQNTRSTFVNAHYHGTSISILQFPTKDKPGTSLPDLSFENTS